MVSARPAVQQLPAYRPPIDHRLMLAGGASGDAGTTACARAAWGVPRGYTGSLPVTINDCEWRDQTNGGTDYVDEAPSGAKPGYGGAGQPAWPAGSKEATAA